ncbi:condensation domain-containing protein [Streptomyces wuyuanensis]|uniref:condensation domain-containing protein n=1 Tax=Streptomyces wuyuanensis TaxID=1196353 RepID=UPI00371BADC6
MPAIATAPLTFGQLSLWRSIEDLPASRLNVATLARVWKLPPGCTEVDIQNALFVLVERHEILRTRFLRTGPRGIEQEIWSADPVQIETVEAPESAEDEASNIVLGLRAQPFEIDQRKLWRAVAVSKSGVSTHLVFCAHHMVVDGTSLDILENELTLALRGEPFEDIAPTCREIAAEEGSDSWSTRRSAAVDYWRRTMSAAPSIVAPPIDEAPVVWGSLQSAPALAAATRFASDRDVSLHSVILAAFCRTLSRHTGRSRFLLGLIAGNRNDSKSRSLVSSLNQIIPLIVEMNPSEEFSELACRIHWQTLKAYRHARFDVDDVAEVGRSSGWDGTGDSFEYIFNFMPGASVPSDGVAMDNDWTIETLSKGRDNGWPLYFRASQANILWCELTLKKANIQDSEEIALRGEAREFLSRFHSLLIDLQ